MQPHPSLGGVRRRAYSDDEDMDADLERMEAADEAFKARARKAEKSPAQRPRLYRHTEADLAAFKAEADKDKTIADVERQIDADIGALMYATDSDIRVTAEDISKGGKVAQQNRVRLIFVKIIEYIEQHRGAMVPMIVNNPEFVKRWRKFLKERVRPVMELCQRFFMYGHEALQDKGDLFDGLFEIESKTTDKVKRLKDVNRLLDLFIREKNKLKELLP
tara:strand:+ start:64 stop:720 length:657 start_codon:yes stop_codon:yes gene_type:complete